MVPRSISLAALTAAALLSTWYRARPSLAALTAAARLVAQIASRDIIATAALLDGASLDIIGCAYCGSIM